VHNGFAREKTGLLQDVTGETKYSANHREVGASYLIYVKAQGFRLLKMSPFPAWLSRAKFHRRQCLSGQSCLLVPPPPIPDIQKSKRRQDDHRRIRAVLGIVGSFETIE